MKNEERSSKKIELTALIKKSEDGGFVGVLKEIPGAVSQAETKEELMDNLVDAMFALFEANRLESEQKNGLFSNNEVEEGKLMIAC